ncbi:MAG TPA: type 2 isopentenyl-diphosphate Delta-isomerase [Firmicutes bacterium]|nr:type 2 isopentenyl-diphosphate Delta-isomerase [Bacillota bacterium]
MRGQRKLDHLRLAQSLGDGPGKSGLDDLHFVHNCLPEINSGDISTETSFLGHRFPLPLLINAITGGMDGGQQVNRALAGAARQMGIPMAVGSQAAALDSEDLCFTYQVAREVNPEGFLMANLSAGTPPEKVLRAVEMIRADALQLHLNVPQEATMPAGEGDASFRGLWENIRHVARVSPVPVIVKEVGFGMAREEARRLLETGIAALDIEGRGGTNFIRIEEERKRKGFNSGDGDGDSGAELFFSWGLPTAVSLIEVLEATRLAVKNPARIDIVAGGGIRSGLDIARVLSLGANMAGIAGPLVRHFYRGGEAAIVEYLKTLEKQLRQVMLMLGAENVYQLRDRSLIITGETGQWLERRGIRPQVFAQRRPSRKKR